MQNRYLATIENTETETAIADACTVTVHADSMLHAHAIVSRIAYAMLAGNDDPQFTLADFMSTLRPIQCHHNGRYHVQHYDDNVNVTFSIELLPCRPISTKF